MHHTRVNRCSYQIVRRTDCMDIPGQVEVEVLHRNDLGVTAAGGSAFDPERRPLRRLANAGHDLLLEHAKGLGQADIRSCLPLPERCGSDRGDIDILPVRPIFEPL